jgi:hypothetical protein
MKFKRVERRCELRVERGLRSPSASQHSTQNPLNPPGLSTQISLNSARAFTLLEVIIACAIFFMVVFAILEMVTGTLASAKALQQREPDAGMLAATLSLTNQLVEGVESGDFEDVAPGLYSGYRWTSEITEVGSNGLFQVDYVVQNDSPKKRGVTESKMSVLMFRPMSKPGSASGRR